MQTTLRIDDDIYRRAKAKSGELGLSLTRFFEEAVEERLTRLDKRPTKPIVLPVSSAAGPPMRTEAFKKRLQKVEREDALESFK